MGDVTYCFASDMIRFHFGKFHEKLTGIPLSVNFQSINMGKITILRTSVQLLLEYTKVFGW